MTTAFATRTFRAAHVVAARHAATQAPVTALRARLEPHPYGWSVRVTGGDVVVTTRDGAPAPTVAPTLELTVTDGVLSLVLAAPAASVPLIAAAITHLFAPVPMVLEVTLVKPADGLPRTGATMIARAGTGTAPRPSIPLPEVAPGVYRSGAATWTAAFTPFDLMIGTRQLRRMSMDFTKPTTKVRLADTT